MKGLKIVNGAGAGIAVSHSPLVFGYWLLATGYWLLAKIRDPVPSVPFSFSFQFDFRGCFPSAAVDE
jgi:hypothetical protein